MKLDHSDLRLVKDRIHAAQTYNEDKLVKARRIDRMRQWYEGDHYNESSDLAKISTADRIVVNYSLINVLVKVGQVAYGDPSFRLRPTRPLGEGYDTALDKQVLDSTWREIEATRSMRSSFFDVKVCGTGVFATNIRIETAKMVYLGGDQPDEREAVVYDNPQVRRLRPEWFLVDPDHPEDWKQGWYAGEKWRLPLFQVRRSPRYAHLGDKLKGLIQPDYARDMKNDSDDGKAIDENLRQVEGYTLYCRDLGLVVDWCPELPNEPLWVGDAEYYPTDPLGRPYYPFGMLSNIPLPDVHWGLSDVEVTESQQAELDVARSQLAGIRRQNNGQLMAFKGVLDEITKKRIQDGVYGAINEVDPGASGVDDIRKAIGLIPRDQAPAELYTSVEKAQADMSELSRTSAFQRGAAVPGVKYATEAALISQGTQPMVADERTQFEKFVAEAGEQVHWLLKRWAKDIRYVELQQGSQSEWQEWTGERLAPRVKCLVEPSSMDPPDSALEEQKWAQRLQLLVPLAAAGLNLRPLVEAYLHSFDFAEIDELLAGLGQPQPPMLPGGPDGANPGADPGGGGLAGQLPPEILAALAAAAGGGGGGGVGGP